MATSRAGPVWKLDSRTGLYYYLNQQTNEYVFSDGTRRRATTQPVANVPRTVPVGATGQFLPNAYQPQPYNQQYTNVPPVAGQNIQNVTRQLQSINVTPPSSFPLTSSANATAGNGRPIDGADVVRNPPIRGTPPRRLSFAPALQQRLLDPAFRLRDSPRRYFVPGKVFLTLWSEPHSATSVATRNNDVFAVAYGQHAFCRIRRFVVIRAGEQSCSALAISTHSGRGAPQTNQSEHGVVFTGRSPPQTDSEPGMQIKAIRVNPDERTAVLDPTSRINYGKLYNVEHNIKVKNFGTVTPESMVDLINQFKAVFTSKIGVQKRDARRPDMTGSGPKQGERQQYLTQTQQAGIARHAGVARNTAVPRVTVGGARGQQQVAGPSGGRGNGGSDDDEDDDDSDDDDEDDDDEEDESDDDDEEDNGDDDDDDDDDDDSDESDTPTSKSQQRRPVQPSQQQRRYVRS